MSPLGVHTIGWKAPSEEERAHDYLWRIHQRMPGAGEQLNYSGGTVQALGFEYDHLRGLLSFTGHTTGRFAASVKK